MSEDPDSFNEAVKSQNKNLLVVAPPGCGKTELLALRAERLIDSLDRGEKILALTFSNKAKANLSTRLAQVLGSEQMRRFVSVHNFHGHAAEIVRAHGNTLGIRQDFAMPNKHSQNAAIEPNLKGLPENEAHELRLLIEEQLRDAKQGPRDDARVLERLRDADDHTILVETERQSSDLMFYDDLLRHAQRLLRVPEISHLYHAHYGAVLVDEFQDLSPQQLDIALRSSSRSRTFVGDPLQGIYSWTGARPIQVEKILRRISGPPRGLGVSYRSSPQVLNLLGIVSSRLGGQTLQCHDPSRWFDGGITAGVAFSTGVAEADFIHATCLKILEGQPHATIGIICRSGWRRKTVDAEFLSRGTPCTRWDLAVDDARIVDLIRDGLLRLGGSPTLESLKDELLSSIDSADVDTASDISDALGQLESLAVDAGSLEAALAQLHVRENSTEAIQPGVHLLNAHTGKGQQFDWVIIPGFENGNMPSFLARGQAQLSEEYRVLLVMLSRARHGVIITRAKTLISKKGKAYSPDPSPWITDIRAGLITNATGLVDHIERTPQSTA